MLSSSVPKHEFDIHSNLKRAARSTTRNIAEGFGRFHFKENIQFCRISRGSLFEMLDDFEDILLHGYVTKEKKEEGTFLVKEAIKSLNGYINYLERRLKNQ